MADARNDLGALSFAQRHALANFLAIRLEGGLPSRRHRARELALLIQGWQRETQRGREPPAPHAGAGEEE